MNNKIIITLKDNITVDDLNEFIKILRHNSVSNYVVKDISMIIENMKLKFD
jgi:hypothetical protein